MEGCRRLDRSQRSRTHRTIPGNYVNGGSSYGDVPYHRRRGGLMPQATPTSHSLPFFRFFPEEEVAILVSGHRREDRLLPEQTQRSPSVPYLRYMPVDEVAMLELPGSNGGQFVDHHRQASLINMSYEALVDLAERLGSVKSGLSEEDILNRLKTRLHASAASGSNSEGASSFCVICQAVFEDQESVAVLDCNHGYHVDCLKEWLLEKNTCPICKSAAV